jgi:hypothetical protein
MPGKKGPDEGQFWKHVQTKKRILSLLAWRVYWTWGVGLMDSRLPNEKLALDRLNPDIRYDPLPPYSDKRAVDMAKEAGLSRTHLYEYLKELRNEQYVTQLRNRKWTIHSSHRAQ